MLTFIEDRWTASRIFGPLSCHVMSCALQTGLLTDGRHATAPVYAVDPGFRRLAAVLWGSLDP